MALRQTYGLNPATGRVEHHYVDCGQMSADAGHGRLLVKSFVPASSDTREQMRLNGGTQQPRLNGAA